MEKSMKKIFVTSYTFYYDTMKQYGGIFRGDNFPYWEVGDDFFKKVPKDNFVHELNKYSRKMVNTKFIDFILNSFHLKYEKIEHFIKINLPNPITQTLGTILSINDFASEIWKPSSFFMNYYNSKDCETKMRVIETIDYCTTSSWFTIADLEKRGARRDQVIKNFNAIDGFLKKLIYS